MVNRIDETQRREQLAEAVWRIIRRDGFDAASVRAVAAEAGLSAGSVRHFFSTQDDLHIAAMESLGRRITRRVDAALDTGEMLTPERARALATGALAQLLPVDAELHDLFLAHLQFATKATVHPPLQATARAIADEMHAFSVQIIRSLVTLGAARADLDVEAAATDLDVLLDGITLRRLTAAHLLSESEALALVDRFLLDLRSTS